MKGIECLTFSFSFFFFLHPFRVLGVVCSPWSTCSGATPIELRPPTATSDRACTGCNPQTEYANVTQSRCVPATRCNVPLEFEAVPTTPISDRRCQQVQQCVAATQYEHRAPTATTDRVCGSYDLPPRWKSGPRVEVLIGPSAAAGLLVPVDATAEGQPNAVNPLGLTVGIAAIAINSSDDNGLFALQQLPSGAFRLVSQRPIPRAPALWTLTIRATDSRSACVTGPNVSVPSGCISFIQVQNGQNINIKRKRGEMANQKKKRLTTRCS